MKQHVTLFINSLTSGGAERVLSVIITELIRQNIAVTLLCIEKDNIYTLPKEVNIIYLSKLTKHDSNIKKFLYLPYLALKLKEHIKENNTPLIQSHIYRANFSNLLAKVFGAKHKVEVVEVISINHFKNKSLSAKINLKLIKLLYKYADLVIFKAQRMKEEFLKEVPNIKNYTVINNPYNIERIEHLAHETVDDFTFNPDKKYLINVGRLSSQKKQITLIETVAKLNDNIELIIIGEGEEQQILEDAIVKYKLKNRVHLLGRKDNPFKYIAQADIFVLASSGEGFPNVIVEAMITATPIISTDCISGPREILAPTTDINFQLKKDIEIAENGILYPIGDNNALVKAINTIFKNRELEENYKKRGPLKAKEYSLERIITQYKESLCVV